MTTLMQRLSLFVLMMFSFVHQSFAYTVKGGTSDFGMGEILIIATIGTAIGGALIWLGNTMNAGIIKNAGGFIFRSGWGTIVIFALIFLGGGIMALLEGMGIL